MAGATGIYQIRKGIQENNRGGVTLPMKRGATAGFGFADLLIMEAEP